ncbi:MAG: polysaccharide export protein [Candidatus Omnitrophica bacterium]|nr:polysaccharide export protein [Candidatus Omnitrophota bacterium]
MKIFITILLLAAVFVVPVFAADPVPQGKYKLQPTDILQITVHGQPDLTTKTRIAADGYISFPLIGQVMARGLTVQDLEEKIKELLEKDYLVKAEVLVFIDEYHPRQVSVMGEVNKPGKFDMPDERDMTVLEAVAMAEGFTKDADVNRTRVMRIEDGKRKTLIVKVKDITERGEKEKDVVVQPDDVVFVPESFF